MKRLEQFHQRSLRRIMGISWEDRVPNTDVLRRAGMMSIEAHITKARLRWAGHVVRMPDTRLPKMILYSELTSGVRRPGGPLKRFKDCLRVSLNDCNIPLLNWEALAADRNAWRLLVHKGVAEAEERRLCRLDTKRQAKEEDSKP